MQTQLLALKPEMDPESTPEAIAESFEELRALNPDTVAWLTLDGTAIDFPIVQGEDDMTYINTDVYGNFSMSGSIFLDSNCDPSFREPYALVYGHHMSDHVMFTDLDLYKDAEFLPLQHHRHPRPARPGVQAEDLRLPDRALLGGSHL